ncbi:MAG: hypothetical protein HYZ28_24025 [Myxococcales bacterium]|nr:hypothetical protein [Myxococcales bacterium]
MGSDGANGEQLEVLRAIWNEMKAVKASLERELLATRQDLGARIDQTNLKLEEVRRELRDEIDSVRRRMIESETRLATATTELSADVRDLDVAHS